MVLFHEWVPLGYQSKLKSYKTEYCLKMVANTVLPVTAPTIYLNKGSQKVARERQIQGLTCTKLARKSSKQGSTWSFLLGATWIPTWQTSHVIKFVSALHVYEQRNQKVIFNMLDYHQGKQKWRKKKKMGHCQHYMSMKKHKCDQKQYSVYLIIISDTPSPTSPLRTYPWQIASCIDSYKWVSNATCHQSDSLQGFCIFPVSNQQKMCTQELIYIHKFL